MDIHTIPGVKARDVAEAHRMDMLIQEEHECKCMTYWIDEERENVFCLIEAPSKESVEELHSRSHGLIPHKIISVNPELVESFLGRIYDPRDATTTAEGLKIFHDPSFRVLLVTTNTDPVLLRHCLGPEKANALLHEMNATIREKLALYDGREVEHPGEGFILSFTAAAKAVSCALDIRNKFPEEMMSLSGMRMSINAGEPVSASDQLFGDTVQLGRQMCSVAKPEQVLLSSHVKELVSKDYFQQPGNNLVPLSPQDEHALRLLFEKLFENWTNPDFSITDFCQVMAMSKSQLYRRTVELTGLSPNTFLRDFRLEMARELMKKQRLPVSQATFDAGFSSPSYFTKCFKKKYGLLPGKYLELLQ